MRPASVSGIVTGSTPVSYWPIFSLPLVTVPDVFAKVNSTQSPYLFYSGAYITFIMDPLNKNLLTFSWDFCSNEGLALEMTALVANQLC